MANAKPTTIYLKDYSPAPQSVVHVDMTVQLHLTETRIETVLHVKVREAGKPMVLDGEGISLVSARIEGVEIQSVFENNQLTFPTVPQHDFKLEIVQTCNPQANTALSGLYVSNNVFCTQMEAEGFRRFAFMQDRPDVMATYRVRVEASQELSVLLSNGNRVASGSIGSNRHFVEWEDPHPKPTYLFALVAGNLASVHDQFTTSEGRDVSLGIYVERGKEDRCAWAMDCLKASMRWDEERFGRAYDLDVFNIVAVSDFNMGAMENKGLNIFNDKYILARPDTATDTDYVNIERIIAHEYFHNWTGNRITCRDWFQLCLKEGLTVYRDQEFTSDLRSRAVKRIEDVKTLRARQFPEDQGPLAHAVRPTSYIEINNFYTPTIYEKGAEICRMLHTLLGHEKFGAAMDLYFERHDGQAATVEDFLRCMADASGRDLSQFAKWYEQAGTPIVEVTTNYNAEAEQYQIELKQHTPPTPQQTEKLPLHMPLGLALLDTRGQELELKPNENIELRDGLFEFSTATATLTFGNIAERPVLSINRSFSSPIILRQDATENDLLFLAAHDNDSFNRWEASQTIAKRLLIDAYLGKPVDVARFANSLKQTINSPSLDDAFKALMLQLPGEAEITVELATDVDAERVHNARKSVLKKISELLIDDLIDIFKTRTVHGTYLPDTASCARRSLKGAALKLLSSADAGEAVQIATSEFEHASNMTAEMNALGSVLDIDGQAVDAMVKRFYDRHHSDHLLLDKWFMLKAARARTADDIKALIMHQSFTYKTPNRVYALIGGFTGGNLAGFHAVDGSGYQMLADSIITLNGINPQVAARMANGFRSWGRYDLARRNHARGEMQRILAHEGLSNDVFEIISRTLKG